VAVFDIVLFDLDGTLTDPASGIVDSFRHALTSVGHPVDEEVDLRWMIGPPIRDNFATFGLPDHLHDDAVVAFRDRHTSIGLYDVTLHRGIPELLDVVRNAGSATAVATFKPTTQAIETIEHLGLADRFDAVVGVGEHMVVGDKGPVIDEALTSAGRSGTSVMIGDRHHDLSAGRSRGCTTVGVRWGYASPGELEACAPDHLVSSVDELTAVLLG
jgi:phosphoglycolate phosphatase